MNNLSEDFWNLKEDQFARKIESQSEFYKAMKSSDDLKNFVYWPKNLIPKEKDQYKIENKSFTNCSFAFTCFENIIFQNCKFINCKFNRAKIKNCNFHECTFKYVNMFKVEIVKTYIEPDSFKNIIPILKKTKMALKNANMCVTFFQNLLENSKKEEQPEHIRQASYYFKKWKGLNVLQKRFYPKQENEAISTFKCLSKFIPNAFEYLLTGYGYRIRNFLIIFIIGFAFFFWKNYVNWELYGLVQKDLKIETFNANSPNLRANFYYTLDSITNIIDSQFQATTNYGMLWLTIQSVFGFVVLTALITIILNKFVR